LPTPAQNAERGLAARAARFEHRCVQSQQVAGPHRVRPLDMFHAGRGKRFGILQCRHGGKPHCDGAGVPAACNQSAEAATRGRFRIGMKPLRIVRFGKADNLCFVHDVRACFEHLAGLEVREFHRGRGI
jgi:hypothetical protein